MNVIRRRLIGVAPAIAMSAFPWRAIAGPRLETARLLCGYPPGGSIDVVCRTLAARLGGSYARTVLVENKPGAAGRIAVEDAKRSPPDGATIFIAPASVLTMYPHVFKNLTYDPFVDLVPLSSVASFGFALVVGPKVPQSVVTLRDFVTWCKANPGMAECGNSGAGSFPHFMAMLFARDAGLELTHIPFKAGSAALKDVAGGQVSAVMGTEPSAVPLLKAGRVRALATSWSDRSPFNPLVPTFKEAGFANLTQREWFGAFVARGTPATTAEYASAALATAARSDETREVWQKVALLPEGSTSAELQAALRKEYDFWGPLIRASGFTPEE